MPTTPVATFPASGICPFYPTGYARQSVRLPASVTYPKGQVLGEVAGNNEVQTITITGTPTGGTFTVTFGGQTTAAIAYNATAATVQAALQAMTSIGANNVTVTGGPGPGTPWVVTFRNALGSTNVAQMTTTDSLTGGASPASAVTTTTQGAAGTPGTFRAYDPAGTDGRQIPKGVLEFDCATDASGNITFGTGTAGNWVGAFVQSAPAFFRGCFATGELTGLDEVALANAGWRLVSGTVGNGVVELP
jgi:hypothetical protein